MHKAAYEAAGLKYRYVALRVEPNDFEEAIDKLIHLGYRGVNLTQPLKELGAKWARHPDLFVTRVGSANTLNLMEGSAANTDAPGFVDTLPALGIWAPAPTLILGAGGAARAIASVLHEAGHRLRIYNRTPERAKKLVDETGIKAEILKEPNPEGVAMVVNTTSAALEGDAIPVQWSRADKRTIAYDISYGEELSPFLLQSGLAGLKVCDGLEMLVAQGARSFEWWLGIVAPLDAMRKAVG